MHLVRRRWVYVLLLLLLLLLVHKLMLLRLVPIAHSVVTIGVILITIVVASALMIGRILAHVAHRSVGRIRVLIFSIVTLVTLLMLVVLE